MTFSLLKHDKTHVTLRYTYGPVTIDLVEEKHYLSHWWSQLGDQLRLLEEQSQETEA